MSEANPSTTTNKLKENKNDKALDKEKIPGKEKKEEKEEVNLNDIGRVADLNKKPEEIIKSYKLKEGEYRIQVKILEATDLVPK